MKKVVSENQRDWVGWLPAVTAAYNASQHESTGYSPYFLMFGRTYTIPVDLTLPLQPKEGPESYFDYVERHAERLRKAFQAVEQTTGALVNRSKQRYDRRVAPIQLQSGDYAWYYCPRRKQGRNQKWRKLWSVCFVEARVNDVNYRIRLTPNARPFTVHIDRLQRFEGDLPLAWHKWNEKRARAASGDPPASPSQYLSLIHI